MKALGVRSAVFAVLACLVAVVASCSNESAATQAAAKKHAKPGPEESFQVIMDTFRRRMEETPVLFVVNNPNGRTSMTGTNKVSSEVFPPKSDGEPYKATITVHSESRYSVKVTSEAPEDSGHEKSSKGDRLSSDKDQKGSDSFDQFSTKGVGDSKSSGQATRASEQVLPHADVEERKYDLVHQDGRWVLVTELNKETEQAIQNAFKSALETQN